MTGLRELFGGSFSALGSAFDAIEKKWDSAMESISSLIMPTSYKNAVEALEYGSMINDTLCAPNPFVRMAALKNRNKWNADIGSLAEMLMMDDDDRFKSKVLSVQEMIRKDIFDSAIDEGVPLDVAEVFGMKFKKNYRKVEMFEWVHGDCRHPRELHSTKWNGHAGKINGRTNGLDGYVFPLDKPPVIGYEKDGREIRGYPGDLPNCSCMMVPVFV